MISKAGIVTNVFSNVEIESLIKNLNKLQNNDTSGHGYTNGFQPDDFIYPLIKKIVIEKLENIFNKQISLTHGMLLIETKPWFIHTDYNKGDAAPDMAYLIPLITANTHTVIFNEESTVSFQDYMKTNNKIENNAKNLYNSLCSHVYEEHLEYVSLMGAFKWQLGSVIYWDRKLLHTSDNFIANGLTEKTALVLFTNNDKRI